MFTKCVNDIVKPLDGIECTHSPLAHTWPSPESRTTHYITITEWVLVCKNNLIRPETCAVRPKGGSVRSGKPEVISNGMWAQMHWNKVPEEKGPDFWDSWMWRTPSTLNFSLLFCCGCCLPFSCYFLCSPSTHKCRFHMSIALKLQRIRTDVHSHESQPHGCRLPSHWLGFNFVSNRIRQQIITLFQYNAFCARIRFTANQLGYALWCWHRPFMASTVDYTQWVHIIPASTLTTSA